MPIVFDSPYASIGEGIRTAGSALAQGLSSGLEGRRNAQKEQKYQTILDQTLGNLTAESSPMDYMDAYSTAIRKGLPAEQATKIFGAYEPYLKQQLQSEQDRALLESLGLAQPSTMATQRPSALSGAPQPKYEAQPRGLDALNDEQLAGLTAARNPMIANNAKAALDLRRDKRKQENELWNYKPTQDTINAINEEAKDAYFGNEVADEIIDVVKSGETSPSNIRNWAASLVGEKPGFAWLFTGESAKLKLLEKLQAKNLRAIFPKPTEREFLFVNTASGQLGKSDEANLAVANLQKNFNAIPIRLMKIKDQIIQENGGVPPRDLQGKILKRAHSVKDELITKSAAITYQFGEGKDKEAARKYLEKVGSPIVKEKTPLTKEIALQIYEEAGGDRAKYDKIVEERGYSQ